MLYALGSFFMVWLVFSEISPEGQYPKGEKKKRLNPILISDGFNERYPKEENEYGDI